MTQDRARKAADNHAPDGWCPSCHIWVKYHGGVERHLCGALIEVGGSPDSNWLREEVKSATARRANLENADHNAAFLSKSLEGADGRVAEIRDWYVVLAALPPEGPGISLAEYKSAFNSLGDLLTLVTALSAKLKEVEGERDRLYEGWKQAFSIGIAKQEEIEKLESKLKEQKAAHAKLLRDEADVSDKSGRDRMASRVLRYLADKIEGGE